MTPEFWSVYSISDDYKRNSQATAVIMLLFLLIGLPGNAAIIVSIIHQKLYKETTHLLLLNLAISDFLVCLLVLPPIIVTGFVGEYIFGSSDYVRCQVCQTGIISIGLTIFSLNILGLISLDRFIFIKFSLYYNQYVTMPRAIVIITITWLLSIFQCTFPLFGFGEISFAYSLTSCSVLSHGRGKLSIANIYYPVFLISLALIPIIFIIVVNIWIACIVRKQIVMVYRTRRSFGNRHSLNEYNKELKKKITKKRNEKQLGLIRAFGAILVSNLVAWMPIIFHNAILLFIDSSILPLGNYSFVLISFVMHSVLHPSIEGCFIPEIKMTFKTVLGISYLQKKWKKQQRKHGIATSELKDEQIHVQGCGVCCKQCFESLDFAVIQASQSSSSSPPPLPA